MGAPPGDGQFLVFQALLGIKRANYYMYTAKTIDAQTALELGLVNEVVPKEKLMERAWELAEMIMKQDRVCRRLTSHIARRPWKRLLLDDFPSQISTEFYGVRTGRCIRDGRGHDRMKDTWPEWAR